MKKNTRPLTERSIRFLIPSLTRRKILYLFLDEKQNYCAHMREVSRFLKIEISAARRELVRLNKIGLLKTKRESNKKVFFVNEDSNLLPELRILLFKMVKNGNKK